MTLRQLTTVIVALAVVLPAAPAFGAYTDSSSEGGAGSGQVRIKLEGRAEVQQVQKDMMAWQAAQLYRQGAYFMSVNDFNEAAECFRQAGDGFDSSVGPGKFLGESRYAEAQCRRLLKQNATATHLFQVAVDIFQQYDPRNPFLKAGRAYLDQLSGKQKPLQAKASTTMLTAQVSQQAPPPQKVELHALSPRNDFIDNRVTLKGKAMQLEGGVDTTELKDGALFNGSHMAQNPITADISDKFVHDQVYKAFIKMTCLEMAALGGNYYTAPESYASFKAGGKTVLTGASEDQYCPVVDMKLNGREYSVPINLPGLQKGTKNVLLATDGLHVIAIDPRNTDTWRLLPNFGNAGAEFNWAKLTHRKDSAKPTPAWANSRTPRVASPFAR